MAREATKQRIFELVKKVRLQRLRGLRQPAEVVKEEEQGPPAEEVMALESLLDAGGEQG